MTQQAFEARLLNLWMTTRVPLTRANLLYYTKAPRKRMGSWLDEMVADGVLEVDADGDGEMVWAVRGAKRPDSGPERIEEAGAPPAESSELSDKLARLKRDALVHVGSATGIQLASQAKSLLGPRKPGDKSLIASGLLSLFFGPFGLLYAAPWGVAVPLSIAMLIAMYLFGWHAIGFSLLFAALGVAYAWRYNQNGKRAPLFFGKSDDSDEKPPALPRKRS